MRADGQRARAVSRTCERIGAYAGELIRHAPVPGGVLVVADRTGPLGTVSFGYSDLERGVPMSPDRLFEIGSISKMFTSMLIGQLAVESRLDLDDPATKWLPWLDLGVGARPATLRALLSHTAGLVLGSDALPDDIAQVWRLRDLAVNAGAPRFHYSNLGFQILGLVLSACAGAPLPDLVRDRLLEPMGMASSLPSVTHADRSRLAVGYTSARQDRPWVPGDPLAPATWFEVSGGDGNIASSGPDMARLIMLLLGRGQVAGRQVVAERVIDEMTTPAAPDGEPVTQLPGVPAVTSSRYGLGINIETIAGNRCLTHGGGMVGYSTFLLVDTTADVGLIVLTNADGDNLHSEMLAQVAHADLLRQFSGEPETNFPLADPQVRWEAGQERCPVPLGTFAATSADSAAATMTVSGEPGGPVTVKAGPRTGNLFRTLTGRFVTDHPDLRRYPLDLRVRDGRTSWVCGPAVYHETGAGRDGSRASDDGAPRSWQALAGHYRCYSPWYPELRIFDREGALWLAASGGTEASSQEEELVEVRPGVFRIGADEWLPERLTAGPVVDGRVISVDRDGCVYSRVFTP